LPPHDYNLPLYNLCVSKVLNLPQFIGRRRRATRLAAFSRTPHAARASAILVVASEQASERARPAQETLDLHLLAVCARTPCLLVLCADASFHLGLL
jgi:hypothetical protein